MRERSSRRVTPSVNIVGAVGYAATLTRRAEILASEGLCNRGAIVIDPRHTEPGNYKQCVAARRATGWTVFETLGDLLADRSPRSATSDLLVLPVPIPLHRPMTEAALGAGFHVLCEKPAAGASEDLDAMARAAAAADRSLWFGYQHPLSGSMSAMFDRVAGGDLGEIEAIVVYASWPRPEQYYTRSRWAGKLYIDDTAVLDSPMQNAMAHFLQAALRVAHLAGFRPTHVSADHVRVNDIETADTQVARVATADTTSREGPPIFLALTHSAHTEVDPVIRVVGTRCSLRWSFPDTLEQRAARSTWNTVWTGPPGEHIHGLALRAALMSLGAETDRSLRVENLVDTAGARPHLRVVEAAFGAHARRRFPPPAVGPEHCRVIVRGPHVFREVIGLDEVIAHAITTKRLLRESAPPWSEAVVQVSSRIDA